MWGIGEKNNKNDKHEDWGERREKVREKAKAKAKAKGESEGRVDCNTYYHMEGEEKRTEYGETYLCIKNLAESKYRRLLAGNSIHSPQGGRAQIIISSQFLFILL